MITLVVKTASAKTFWRCGRMFSEVPQTFEVTDEEALVILGEPMLKAEEAKPAAAAPAPEPSSTESPADPDELERVGLAGAVPPPAPKPEQPKRK